VLIVDGRLARSRVWVLACSFFVVSPSFFECESFYRVGSYFKERAKESERVPTPPITKRFSSAIISAIIIVSEHNERTAIADNNGR